MESEGPGFRGIDQGVNNWNEKRAVMQKEIQFDEIYDVVVIGSGFAGLAAAIEAKQAGASVIILEKMKGRGGNSSISDGYIAAAGTALQARHGIQDSPEQMSRDMVAAGLELNHPELVQTVTENSNNVIEWLRECIGVEFIDRVEHIGGHSVPRTLWIKGKASFHTGAEMVHKMLAKVKALRIEVRTQAFMRRLLDDTDGKVFGVEIVEGLFFPKLDGGVAKNIQAKRGVILASGGYANDIPFRTAQDPRLTADIETTNRRGATAEALVEAMRIGAMPIHLSCIQIGPWASPDEKGSNVAANFATVSVYPHGIVVDPQTGRRILNERGDRKQRADVLMAVGHPCIGIADAEGAQFGRQFVAPSLKKGSLTVFDSLEQLAAYHRISAVRLQETVTRFNKILNDGHDPDFKRPIKAGEKPLVKQPFYALRLVPKIHYTMGGVRIDTQGRVIGLDRKPIKGLFAAGEVVGGIHGACRLGSCAITECLVFGRIAGQNAAGRRS
jgi:flavocytochrome c